ncbi:MAG: hypothetical protein ABL891_15015 [Burkholderiales bacterium]
MNTLQSTGWISRILVALITVALLILGFFFLTVALVAGAIVAAVFGARLWWTLRKLKRAQAAANDANVVEGDYQIIEHESIAVRLPPKQSP